MTSDEPSTAERILADLRTQPDLLDRPPSDGVVEDDEAEEWREAASIHLDGQEDFDEDDLEESDPEDVPEEDDPAAYRRGAVRTGQGISFRTQRPNQFTRCSSIQRSPRRSALARRSSSAKLPVT